MAGCTVRRTLPGMTHLALRGRRPMNKILIGVILGTILGFFDGATSWFTPEVRKEIVGILIGS